LFRPPNPKLNGSTSASEAGFSLLEALAALTVAAIMLGALGTLTHSTVRSVMFTEHRVALIETARKVFAALPPRGASSDGPIAGELDGSHWRINVRPYFDTSTSRGGGEWEPELIEIEVRGSDGSRLQFDTVRIRRRGAA
jgi:hypothetical protein